MPLQKILFKPGVNRENTRYTTEGGWYDCDKIRFRQGTPEKIGGWVQTSARTFMGVCRSLWAWATLTSQILIGVGTNLKFYIEKGGAYYDITPLRSTVLLGSDPFSTQNGSSIVTVSDSTSGYKNGDFVTFTGATAVAGLTLNGNYQIAAMGVAPTTYTVDAGTAANATTTGGGSAVYAAYEVPVGPSYTVPNVGWGAGPWGYGTWGNSFVTTDPLRIWNQDNYGQDLLFGPRGGQLYYWYASVGVQNTPATISIGTPAVVVADLALAEQTPISFTTTGALPSGLVPGTIYYTLNVVGDTFNLSATPGGAAIDTTGSQSGIQYVSPRGIPVADIAGASSVPLYQNFFLVSDASRFVICFGTNDFGQTDLDPMLVRWSDQESVVEWSPAITNQSGSIRLSHGSKIVTALQARQEILVWTDSSLYSLQYAGPPYVWPSQLLSDNLSIVGPNCTALASGTVYWMGQDKFYKYDGRVQTLRCDLREYIFQDINVQQFDQVVAGTNEGFNEVWWFYCSSNSTVIDKYAVYNYAEDIWYYGTMGRTAWLDAGILSNPIGATYSSNIVNHEEGVDDNTSGTPAPIDAYISSSEFDIGDGHNFGFVWRLLPDVTFRGSTATNPQVTMYLIPLQNSGSGYTTPASVGGSDNGPVTRTAVVPVEQFTGQVNIRVRGRQMAFKIESNQVGTTWQLGAPRIDIRADGRRGG